MKPAIDLYVFAERYVFDTDAAWLEALRELAATDVPGLALQVRTKSEPPDRALKLARDARKATRNARVPVLLNGSTAEALELGYGGVHWPEALIPAEGEPLTLTLLRQGSGQVSPEGRGDTNRKGRADTSKNRGASRKREAGVRSEVAGHDLLRGASVHSVEACDRAEAAGADFVVAGTIFDAGSKPVAGEGLEKLRSIVEATRLPVLAIGGVRPDRVKACLEAGAAGVAVVTSVLRAPDLPAAVRELREALDEAHARTRSGVAATFRSPKGAS
jgi:thiamine monophosphate synthase